MSLIVRDARSAFNYLNGVFCIYKAVKTPYKTLINNIKHHLKSGKLYPIFFKLIMKSIFLIC